MTIVQLEDVKKIYTLGKTEVPAVRGVSFSIKKGDFASIVGPSGSGKSTILNMIGCIDQPTEGKVIINGGELTSLCQDAPWKGVFVEGYENLPQSGESITQGTLILNNSTISNAFCGVMLGNPYYENNPLGNYNYAGGIVIATNSNFINNEIFKLSLIFNILIFLFTTVNSFY